MSGTDIAAGRCGASSLITRMKVSSCARLAAPLRSASRRQAASSTNSPRLSAARGCHVALGATRPNQRSRLPSRACSPDANAPTPTGLGRLQGDDAFDLGIGRALDVAVVLGGARDRARRLRRVVDDHAGGIGGHVVLDHVHRRVEGVRVVVLRRTIGRRGAGGRRGDGNLAGAQRGLEALPAGSGDHRRRLRQLRARAPMRCRACRTTHQL